MVRHRPGQIVNGGDHAALGRHAEAQGPRCPAGQEVRNHRELLNRDQLLAQRERAVTTTTVACCAVAVAAAGSAPGAGGIVDFLHFHCIITSNEPALHQPLAGTGARAGGRGVPAVVLTGPRQSGKTTLLHHLFGERYRYVSLEPPDVRTAAANDPRGFLERYSAPVIFDEVQYAPDLLPYVKEKIDASRATGGQYLLTGSQNLLLAEKVTESLAGRAAMLRLLPLSRREAEGRPRRPLAWERKPSPSATTAGGFGELWQGFLRGGYPELAIQPDRDLSLWHASYIQTYLERDLRTLRQVGDLTQYQNFLRLLAARSAQLLSLTDVARDLGVAVNTIKAWLAVLEATYQVDRAAPLLRQRRQAAGQDPEGVFLRCRHALLSRGPQGPPSMPPPARWAERSWRRRCCPKSCAR